MSGRALHPRSDICQLCDFIVSRQGPRRLPRRQQSPILPLRAFSTGRRLHAEKPRSSNAQSLNAVGISSKPIPGRHRRTNGSHATQAELEQALREVKTTCNALLALKRVPSEKDINYVLGRCEAMAKLLVYEPPSPSLNQTDGAASVLLSVDDSGSKKIPPHKLPPTFQHMADELSSLAYAIVKHPPVFITPEALEQYVGIQACLGKPETFPEVFQLYANKPLPEEGSSPIRYLKQNPKKVANAISVSVAHSALQTAIDAKQLAIAMDIIESSFTTTAFHRAKFVRKGLLPATGLAVAPVAAYTIASQLAILQTTMDSAMATNVAFAGILAYLGFTTTIGVVAVTTANDQMDRVTWAPGVPLRERWMREEERAAIDKVAGAWGFRETWRRGEEEGEDWDALREWVGSKAMMLDRVELMEGME
jgi:hypothetical protein